MLRFKQILSKRGYTQSFICWFCLSLSTLKKVGGKILGKFFRASSYLWLAGSLTVWVGCFFLNGVLTLQATNVGIAVIAAASGQLFLNELWPNSEVRDKGWNALFNLCLILAIFGGSFMLPVWLKNPSWTIAVTFLICFLLGMFQRAMGWMGQTNTAH